MDNTKQKYLIAKTITLLSYFTLLAGFTLWQFLDASGGSLFIWIFQCLSLLVFLPWIRANRPRAYIGVCFVTLIYFMQSVVDVVVPVSPNWYSYLVLASSVTLFISAMMTSRWVRHASAHYPSAANQPA